MSNPLFLGKWNKFLEEEGIFLVPLGKWREGGREGGPRKKSPFPLLLPPTTVDKDERQKKFFSFLPPVDFARKKGRQTLCLLPPLSLPMSTKEEEGGDWGRRRTEREIVSKSLLHSRTLFSPLQTMRIRDENGRGGGEKKGIPSLSLSFSLKKKSPFLAYFFLSLPVFLISDPPPHSFAGWMRRWSEVHRKQ